MASWHFNFALHQIEYFNLYSKSMRNCLNRVKSKWYSYLYRMVYIISMSYLTDAVVTTHIYICSYAPANFLPIIYAFKYCSKVSHYAHIFQMSQQILFYALLEIFIPFHAHY